MSPLLVPSPDRRAPMLLAAVLGATDAVLGATLLFSGDSRVSSPAFNAAKNLMPMRLWGAALLVLGAWTLSMAILDRHPGIGLSFAAGWYAFFVATLAVGVATDSHVAFTGCVTYGGVVIVHVLTALGKIR